MNWSVLATVLPALFAAIVGGGVVHLLTRRRDAENERRKQRLEYLLGAYRTLAQAAHRDLQGERGEQFEGALDDILMLGTQEQISAARHVISALAADRQAPIDNLLVSLRRDLRAELGLPDDGLAQVPSVRLGESFDQAAARTAVAVAAAATQADATIGSPAGAPTLSGRLAELRNLAERAPGAAVATAYQLVSVALAELLARNDVSCGTETDGARLAEIAASSDLVSAQLLETIRGLAVMKDLSWHRGSGTGLSPEQANQYLDLTAAALYVLDHAVGVRPEQAP